MTDTPVRPGTRNLITDVGGLLVGNAEDRGGWTGVTVVLPDAPVVAAVDVRGGGPGSRDLAVLEPENIVDRIHGIALSGGSAYGLDAGGGVMSWLAQRGQGNEVLGARVPLVPTAILFDLVLGGDKSWLDSGATPPYRALAIAACDAAAEEFAMGNAGAGFAATAGTLKGGLGSASACTADGVTVGALAAVNAMGRVTYRDSPRFYAGEFELAGELGEQQRFPVPMDHGEVELPPAEPGTNTTLAVVATNVALDQGGAKRLAIMAQDGLARAIRPVHTPFDGDIVFALSTGSGEAMSDPRRMAQLGHLASACVARAVMRGVFEADSLGIAKSYRALHGGALRGKELGG